MTSTPAHGSGVRVRHLAIVGSVAILAVLSVTPVMPHFSPDLGKPSSAHEGPASTGHRSAVARNGSPAGPDRAPQEVQVSDSGGIPSAEPTLAVNHWGTIFVDFEHKGRSGSPSGPASVATSNDSGASFAANVTVNATPPSQGEVDVSTAGSSPNGTVWIAYLTFAGNCTGSNPEVDTVTSWDNGSKWSAPSTSIPCQNTPGAGFDRPWIASTPNGTVFEVVSAADDTLWTTHSWDGIHFSVPVPLVEGARSMPTAANAFAWNDTLWGVGDTLNSTCQVEYTEDSGRHWLSASSSPAGCPGDVYAWSVIWGANASLDLTYLDAAGTEFTRSTDRGSSWSTPVLVSGAVPTGTSFLTPTLWWDHATGVTAEVWLDTRLGTSRGNWSVYESESLNNGSTWTSPRLLSSPLVGTGAQFWPGDFIRNAITPWGTSAGAWGENTSVDQLQSFFAQLPLEVPETGNVSLNVVDSQGLPIPHALVHVDGRVARTDGAGNVVYYAVAPGSALAEAAASPFGQNSTVARVIAGATTHVTLALGTTQVPPLSVTYSLTPSEGAAPLDVFGNVSATGGIGPYAFAWTFGNDTTPTMGNRVSHVFAGVGTWNVTLTCTDSAGHSSTAKSVVLVRARILPLELTYGSDASRGPAPLEVTFWANATGGTGPMQFTWSFGDGSAGPGLTDGAASHTYLVPGEYNASVTVTDSSAPSLTSSGALRIEVAAARLPSVPLAVTLSVNPDHAPIGTLIELRAIPRGGSNSYSVFQWDFGDGGEVSTISPEVNHTYALAATIGVNLWVTDSNGTTAHANATLQIFAPCCPRSISNGISGGPDWLAVGIGGAGAAVGLIAGVWLARRRRRPR